jgi:hypothetical protein
MLPLDEGLGKFVLPWFIGRKTHPLRPAPVHRLDDPAAAFSVPARYRDAMAGKDRCRESLSAQTMVFMALMLWVSVPEPT